MPNQEAEAEARQMLGAAQALLPRKPEQPKAGSPPPAEPPLPVPSGKGSQPKRSPTPQVCSPYSPRKPCRWIAF